MFLLTSRHVFSWNTPWVSVNIEAVKSEPEATFEMKLDQLKADHMKTIGSLDMEVLAIESNKPSSSFEKYPLISSNCH